MGKTYVDTVKYMVNGIIEIDGVVEKPDIVGALFGQTEGLLSDELDLRELQKSGRIGRIEVNTKSKDGKTSGTLTLPSSLDKTETAILAAALETVDRVGPCIAKVSVTGIEDTRKVKRTFVEDRAKELLAKFGGGDKKELKTSIKQDMKIAGAIKYGKDELTAGPEVEKSNEVIIVEGRADVLNLLRFGIKNAIAMQGSIVPQTIKELMPKKTITLFVDGDRGGEINIKHVSLAGKIHFVARAPDGKEVEELTQKEILACLKHKQEYRPRRTPRREAPRRDSRNRESHGRDTRSRSRPRRDERPRREYTPHPQASDDYKKVFGKIKDKMKAVLVDKEGKTKKTVQVAEMINEIEKSKDLKAVVFDGIITQRLVDLADSKGITELVGLKEAKIDNKKKVKTFVIS